MTLRALVVFAALWFCLRVTGKREVSQLSAFELILFVTLGDLIAQAVLQEDYSVTGALLVVALFTLLSVLLSYLSWKFPRARPILESSPTILLRDGEPDLAAMAAERLHMHELMSAARERGIRDLGDVDLVLLENEGAFSFFTRESDTDEPTPGKETIS